MSTGNGLQTNSKIKVLYITGWGRSGTTLLDNILGQVDGFFSVGELRYIWDRNLIDNMLCGCGRPFNECPVWTQVLHRAFGGIDQIDVHEMIRLRDRARTRHLPLMLLPWEKRLVEHRLTEYRAVLSQLYCAIHSVTKSRVIVDSSKFPSYGYVLAGMPMVDLYIVHLVRDPRGVAYSWLKRKPQPDRGQDLYMERFDPFKSSMIWNTWNLTAEAFWNRTRQRYMKLRYEDFVWRPQEAMNRILNLVQEEADDLPFVDTRKVRLGINHTVSGNPNRLNVGTVEIRPDEEWRSRMKLSDKAIVTALTWPLLIKYKYFTNIHHSS